MLSKAVKIKKYETRLIGKDIHYFAIGLKGEEYEMPPQFSDMYNEHFLAIRRKTFVMPELFALKEGETWIPLRTS